MVQVKNLQNCSIISQKSGVLRLSNDTGILSFNIEFESKPESLKIQVEPWSQGSLEGFYLDGEEYLDEERSKIAKISFENEILVIEFTSEGISKLKSGTEVKLLDFYR